MYLKWLGVLIVLAGCGGFGFGIAGNHRREVRNYRQLITVLDYMECELEYRLTPLPELCRQAAIMSSGTVQRLFTCLHEELTCQISPDAECCMNAAIAQNADLSSSMKDIFRKLGRSLGRFDLAGQLQGLQAAHQECMTVLDGLTKNQEERIRSYQTLGLCAGAAIAILFL